MVTGDQLDLFRTPEPPADEPTAVEALERVGEIMAAELHRAARHPAEMPPADDCIDDPFGTILACIAFAQGLACPLLERIRELGRLPNLADDRKPWAFKGWLLPYVIDPRPESRWYWWLETMCARRPVRVMPYLELNGEDAKSPAYVNLRKATESIARSRGGAPELVTEWLAWGLGVAGAEQPRIEPEDADTLYRTLNLDLWTLHPGDHLGLLYCEYKGRGYDPAGFFPTPQHLVRLMAKMTHPEPSLQTVGLRVSDPCVGTGRTLLEAANISARLSGQDIQRRCVLATLVNGAMYAPWLAFPFPERFFAKDEESAAATLLAQ